jgi:hypothetical protein
LLQNLKASETQAALCSAVPRFSCAEAVVAQSNAANAAIQELLVLNVISDLSVVDRPEAGRWTKPGFSVNAALTKN